MKPFLLIVLTALIIIILPYSMAHGYIEIKKRWQIDCEYQPLKPFTYVNVLKERENYYYIIYTLENKSDQPIPLNIDVYLKVDLTRPDLVAEGYSQRTKYYPDSLRPFVEDAIIYTEEKIIGLSPTVKKDRVKELKDKLSYLNCVELRNKKEIRPNEKLTGIAIFANVDPQAKLMKVMVGGLVDVVKRRYEDETLTDAMKNSSVEKDLQEARAGQPATFEYENQIRIITYLVSGSEFKYLKEVITAPKWVIQNYGPIGDKNSLGFMIKVLTNEDPLIRWSSYFLLRRLTSQSFDYNADLAADSPETQTSVKLWQEWWFRNKDKLTYNPTLNLFETPQTK
jgi:hypothetical protein